MDITIIHEDADLLILNKPSGVVVHPDGRTQGESVTRWLERYYPQLVSIGGDVELPAGGSVKRFGLVHRIDRETSGLLVVAKNQVVFEYLQGLFQTRQVEKTYHAFVYGALPQEEGVIDLPIGRSRSDFRQWSAEKGARGQLREAVTQYKVLDQNTKFSFVEIKPKTGRTHQIRVHFKALQHPIVSDRLYASKQPQALGFDRVALHARTISFIDMHGNKRFFEAPYPEDFITAQNLMKKFAK